LNINSKQDKKEQHKSLIEVLDLLKIPPICSEPGDIFQDVGKVGFVQYVSSRRKNSSFEELMRSFGMVRRSIYTYGSIIAWFKNIYYQ
jgi:hypothetical protein